MITAEQLLTFCSKEIDVERFQKPFRFRGKVYATNGRICIRIPDRPDFSIRDVTGESNIDYSKVFTDASNCDMEIPDLPDAIVCKHCLGDGKNHEIDCPDCNGEGCENCDLGYKRSDYPSIDGAQCWFCSGHGEQQHNPVKISGVFFNRIYLAIAKQIPGARFTYIAENEAAQLKFEGGEIALMPTRNNLPGV